MFAIKLTICKLIFTSLILFEWNKFCQFPILVRSESKFKSCGKRSSKWRPNKNIFEWPWIASIGQFKIELEKKWVAKSPKQWFKFADSTPHRSWRYVGILPKERDFLLKICVFRLRITPRICPQISSLKIPPNYPLKNLPLILLSKIAQPFTQ